MISDDNLHHRRSVRLPGYDYSASGAYFVTIVTHNRMHLFGEIVDEVMRLSPIGRVAEECWCGIPAHFRNAEIGMFVVMPNHVHGIIILHEREAMTSPPVGAQHAAPLHAHVESGSLGAIIRSFKAAVTRSIGQAFVAARHVWQRNYYEHVIRGEEDWNRVHLYIENNIANWAGDEENVRG